MLIANFSDETLTLPKHTGLGMFEEVSESVRNRERPNKSEQNPTESV